MSQILDRNQVKSGRTFPYRPHLISRTLFVYGRGKEGYKNVHISFDFGRTTQTTTEKIDIEEIEKLARYEVKKERFILSTALREQVGRAIEKASIGPEELSEVLNEIEDSRHILSLKHDWDSEGSPPFAEETWLRATQFVEKHAEFILLEHGIVIETPSILPGPDGSIDIHWETEDLELLVNFPADHGQPSSFYGDDRGAVVIRGTLDTETLNRGLLLWLAKF